MKFKLKRRRNPVSKKEIKTRRERDQEIKYDNMRKRVKLMRPYFGTMFKASEGYDLRSHPKTWTRYKREKLTRYFRVMAPRITGGDFVVKRYRRKDHLDDAIRASLQEEQLRGQRAAVFSVEKGEEINIDFDRKHQVRVKRDGIHQESIVFDKDRFLTDWKAEVERNLEMTDAKLFKIITGANKSTQTFTRSQIMTEIADMIERYSEENVNERGFDERWFGEWLNGIVAYKGVNMKTMRKRDKSHIKEVKQRTFERLKALAERRKSFSAADMRSVKTTGRSGRVK